ncbi:MAG: hypothetical protein ACLVHV_12350, partial [Oscillospiraceae bacterium]
MIDFDTRATLRSAQTGIVIKVRDRVPATYGENSQLMIVSADGRQLTDSITCIFWQVCLDEGGVVSIYRGRINLITRESTPQL